MGTKGGVKIHDAYKPIGKFDTPFINDKGNESWVRFVYKDNNVLNLDFDDYSRDRLFRKISQNKEAIKQLIDHHGWMVPLHEVAVLEGNNLSATKG